MGIYSVAGSYWKKVKETAGGGISIVRRASTLGLG
jgi:hypothetical protein